MSHDHDAIAAAEAVLQDARRFELHTTVATAVGRLLDLHLAIERGQPSVLTAGQRDAVCAFATALCDLVQVTADRLEETDD